MEKKMPSRIKRKRNIKLKKNTIGVFVAFVASVFSIFYVFAGENNKLVVQKVESAAKGSTVNLKINLQCTKEYNSAGFDVEFDKDVLEYVRTTLATTANPAASDEELDEPADPLNFLAVAPNKTAEVAEANENGKISLGYAIPDGAACEDITMATVRFRVKSDAAGGKTNVTVTNAKMAKELDGEEKEILTVDVENGYIVVAAPVDPDSVALAKTDYTIQKGETDTLTVVYSPEDTTDSKEFTYVSNDTNVVTVNSEGVMTAVGSGSTTVTVTAFGKTLTANVTVENHVTAVNVTGAKTEIAKEETLQLTGTPTPADADAAEKVLTWASSNDEIATVTQEGLVTGVSGGTVTITATSANDVVGTYTVSVVVPMTDFSTTDTTVELAKGETKEIMYTITPNDTTESKEITWTSSNEEVATVNDNGVVTAVGGGTATITGTLPNERHIDVTVNVNVPLESITLSAESIELLPTQKQTVEYEINPSDTTEEKTVTWATSDPSVATVSNGEITAVAAGTATITATVGSKSDTVTVKVLKQIETFTISEPTVTLDRNEEKTLSVTILPADAEEDKTVTWSSSDPTSVSVDQTGKIKGLKGTQDPVTITAALANGKTVTSEVTVVVKLTGIDINKTSTTLNKGANETLVITYDPEDTSDDKTVTWESSDTTVATVDANGKVTAVKAGTATITATVGTFSKICTVTVVVPLESVTIDSEDFTLNRAATKTLTATKNPEDTTDESVITWSSSNTAVATVDSTGVVTAVAAGNATITATAGEKTDTVKVTVVVPITDFTVDKTEASIVKYKTLKLNTTITPNDTTEETEVTWTSSNTSVATVAADGTVTAVAAGTATITGKLENGMEVTTAITVTTIPVTKITISDETLDMKKNDETKLTVTYEPDDATEVTDVTWSSSDPTVASVAADGTVTALKEGTATITATMGTLTDTTAVTVTEIHLEGISLEENDKTETVGDSFKLNVTLEPAGATDDITYTYESSDEDIATVAADGTVTSKKPGTVTITVKATANGQTYQKTIEITFNAPASPQTGVTPVWIYIAIIAILASAGFVIYKKRESL